MTRLDLSGHAPMLALGGAEGHKRLAKNYNELLAEALRAQRSEDELKERVRVLEEAIARHLTELDADRLVDDVDYRLLVDALAGGKEGGV